MGFLTSTARDTVKTVAARADTRKPRGLQTDPAPGKVHCRKCGRPVRSRLGDYCSRVACQLAAVAAAEDHT